MEWIYQFPVTIPKPPETLLMVKVGAFALPTATHVHLSIMVGPTAEVRIIVNAVPVALSTLV